MIEYLTSLKMSIREELKQLGFECSLLNPNGMEYEIQGVYPYTIDTNLLVSFEDDHLLFYSSHLDQIFYYPECQKFLKVVKGVLVDAEKQQKELLEKDKVFRLSHI